MKRRLRALTVAVICSLASLALPRPARRQATVPPLPAVELAVTAAPPAVRPPAAAVPATAPAERPTHVVIISEDGLRPDALTVDLAPNHVALMKESTVARSAMTIPQSDTLPSHASMLSGFPVRRHGLRWNSFKPAKGYIHVPTIFSIAKQAGLSTAMVVGKTKLRHIAPRGTVGHFERPSYLCGGVSRRAAAYFTAEKPKLLFVHFSDPDEYGHSHGWMSPEYLQAVRNSDRCLGTLLAAIDGSDVSGSTLVIVTADHGGHGRQHSRNHDDAAERQIPWIARGPGAGVNEVLETPITTMDTAATVLAALQLSPSPGTEGVARLPYP